MRRRWKNGVRIRLQHALRRWERAAVAYLPAGYDHSPTIITDAAATGSVRLDAQPVTASWAPVTVSASAGCGGVATKDVTVYPAPVPGDALVSHPDP